MLINLIYILAAIRERTGQELSLDKVRALLLAEGLITPKQAADDNLIFRGYEEYFATEEAAKTVEPVEYLLDLETPAKEDN